MTEITAPKSAVTAEQFADEIREQLKYTQGVTVEQAKPADVYVAASAAVRRQLLNTWKQTQADMVNDNTKADIYEITVERGFLYVKDQAEKPKTGDSSDLLLLLALMSMRGAGAAGAAGTVPRRVGGMSVHEYCRSDQADGEHRARVFVGLAEREGGARAV